MNKTTSILLFSLVILLGCTQNFPKPRGNFRIDLPEKNYQKSEVSIPFSFEYPTYCQLNKIKSQDEASEDWYNLVYPKFNALLHLSYIKVDGNYQKLAEDSRRFVYEHTVKADAINENLFHDDTRNVHGICYEIEGNAASSFQFIATDSANYFLRGALYFNNKPNADSIAPVFTFIKTDIYHIIETLNWK